MITEIGPFEGLEMELTTDDSLSQAMPPLAPLEEMRLTKKLKAEGCKETVKVFILDGKYVIVDGHNRYRICRRLRIPFKVEVLPIKTLGEAKAWLIETQLGRRNVSDFVKCEHVLPLEDAFRKEARKRQGARNDLVNIPENFQESSGETYDELGKMINLSGRTVRNAKWLIENAAERTKEDLRKGTISIHMAYSETMHLLKGDDEGIRRRVFNGELTIQKIVEERKKEAKRKQEAAAMELRSTSPIDAEGGKEDDVEDDVDYWDDMDVTDDDPTHGGKIVPLFGRRRPSSPTGSTSNSLTAGGYEIGLSQANNREGMQGNMVSIIPYLKTKGWDSEDHFDEDGSEIVGEPNDDRKGKILSLIPYLKAKGRLPMDYEERENCEEKVGYEEQDEDYGDPDYGDQDFREDDAYEPVVPLEQRVVNIEDIKICDPSLPLPTRGVSLIGAVNEQGSNSGDSIDMVRNENDMLQRIRTEGVCVHTVNFDEILNAMKRITLNFQEDVAVLLSAIRPEDRTEENGTQVTAILNDSIATIINKYTEVF